MEIGRHVNIALASVQLLANSLDIDVNLSPRQRFNINVSPHWRRKFSLSPSRILNKSMTRRWYGKENISPGRKTDGMDASPLQNGSFRQTGDVSDQTRLFFRSQISFVGHTFVQTFVFR